MSAPRSQGTTMKLCDRLRALLMAAPASGFERTIPELRDYPIAKPSRASQNHRGSRPSRRDRHDDPTD